MNKTFADLNINSTGLMNEIWYADIQDELNSINKQDSFWSLYNYNFCDMHVLNLSKLIY